MPIASLIRARRSGAKPTCSRPHSSSGVFRPWLEWLEERVLLSAGDSIAHAIGLSFSNNTSAIYQTVRVTEDLADASDVQLNRISLNPGDMVTASVNTIPYGSGLNSYLRIFEEMSGGSVRQIASNDNLQGQDPGLTFQADGSGTGVYYVGVSSFDNTAYLPKLAGSGTGLSNGLFDLTLTKTSTPAPKMPLLVGSSFAVSPSVVVGSDTITVNYTVENRGGASTSASTPVSLLLSADNRFDNLLSPALSSAPMPSLAAGESATGSFTVTLPNSLGSSPIYLGLQIGSDLPNNPEQGNDWAPLSVLTAETALAVASISTLNTAQPIEVNSRTSGIALAPGQEAFFKIPLTLTGNLTATIDSTSPVALSLYDAKGLPIVQSDGQSATDPGPRIAQSLTGESSYYLKVTNRGPVGSIYTLTTLFALSGSTLQTVPLGGGAIVLVQGDFNGDGRLDLATATEGSSAVTVLLGNGDGTFQNAGSFSTGGVGIQVLTVGDFFGDGRLDLVAANGGGSGVSILRGNGDGTFPSHEVLPVTGGTALAVGDFNGDGNLDLALTDQGITSPLNTVTVLLGDGNGSFQSPLSITVPGGPVALVAGDFNEDGLLDLAVVDATTSQVTELLGNGNGTFQIGSSFDVGTDPFSIVAGDFTGDGHLDLATANYLSGNVTVLLGDGHGSFPTAGTYAVGNRPKALTTGDFNGDGLLDLAVANYVSNDVTVLLGQSHGTFRSAGAFDSGSGPETLMAGDFNGDGRVDLAVANFSGQNVELLLGNDTGTFATTGASNSTGPFPDALVAGDFNGDGRLDLAVANRSLNEVTILLGQGDGTFQTAGSYSVGTDPRALVTGDFNGDGRLDLVVADYNADYSDDNDVRILLGNGDGTFEEGSPIRLLGRPSALVAGDFDGDGHLDLAVTIKFNANSSFGSSVEVFRGIGNGTFKQGVSFATGTDGIHGIEPVAMVAGDFFGDGHLDLATLDNYSDDVTVLRGDGQGNFQIDGSYSIVADAVDQASNFGLRPIALVAEDFNGDTHLDLAVASQSYYFGDVTVLLNDGHGAFQVNPLITTLAAEPLTLVAGDFTGDGKLDLAISSYMDAYPNPIANNVTVLMGNGGGNFSQTSATYPVGNVPASLVTGDFNGDGHLDLVAANAGSANVTTLLGTGTGSFLSPVLAPSPVQSTPLLAPLTGSADDAVVLTQTGQILFRRGLTNEPGAFAPPVVLNPGPQMAARDIALVSSTGGGFLLAALNSTTFTVAGAPSSVPRVTLYQPHPDGTFTILTSLDLPAGFLYADIASADLTGLGLGDLVISAADSDQVFVFLQTSPGVFSAANSYAVGVNPSAIDLVDVNNDRSRDIVVTDRFSGQVSVLLNNGFGLFGAEERFRAGTGLYDLALVNGTNAVQSLEGTNGVVDGNFDGTPGTDLVAINSGSDSFTLLSGDGQGGFLNPQPALTVFTDASPTAVVAGHFITGDPNLDLAVLSGGSDDITIYRSDGHGGFTKIFTVNAGNHPTGLAVDDVSRPGGGGPDSIQDLLVGNAFGDLLILTGNGNGMFSQYVRANQNVSLAVAGSATGQQTFFFSDKGNDQLAYKSAAAGTVTVADPTVFQTRSTGIQAPGPQAVVTVAATQYLVVANSGGNDVLIYTLDSNGQPIVASKQTYFAGTDPVSITVSTSANDLNGDTIPDVVVANEGSNDVSIFLGQLTNNTWTLLYRPRQSTGGLGPTAVAIADVTGANGTGSADSLPDLLVSNGQSNDVTVLPNRGNGFFINQSAADALPLNTGSDPQQLFVGNFDNSAGLDLVTVNAISNDVTLFANFMTDLTTSTVSTGGTSPVAVAAEVDSNGTSALLVANAGNGLVELLMGGPAGFEVAGTTVQSAVAHLSDLALVTAGNELDVYGTASGRETAVLLGSFGSFVTPPFVAPPSPGLPNPTDIPGEGGDTILQNFAIILSVSTLDINRQAALREFEAGSIAGGGVIGEGLALGIAAGNVFAIPGAAPQPGWVGPTEVGEQGGTGAMGSGKTRVGDKGADSFLLNVGEPELKGPGPINPNNPEQSDEARGPDPWANIGDGERDDLFQRETRTVFALPLDNFWRLTGEELHRREGPTALTLQRAGMMGTEILKPFHLSAGPGCDRASPPTLMPEETDCPRPLADVPRSNDLQSRERLEVEEIALAAVGAERVLAGTGPREMKWTETAAAAVVVTGVWHTFARRMSRSLQALARSWIRLRLLLRG